MWSYFRKCVIKLITFILLCILYCIVHLFRFIFNTVFYLHDRFVEFTDDGQVLRQTLYYLVLAHIINIQNIIFYVSIFLDIAKIYFKARPSKLRLFVKVLIFLLFLFIILIF